MDIKNSEEKLKDIDSLLTTLTKVLKKHWIIITLITLGTLGYFIITAEDAVPVEPEIEYVEEVPDSLYYEEVPAEEF